MGPLSYFVTQESNLLMFFYLVDPDKGDRAPQVVIKAGKQRNIDIWPDRIFRVFPVRKGGGHAGGEERS